LKSVLKAQEKSTLSLIVEGAGDAASLPLLARKILDERLTDNFFISRPINAHGKTNLTKYGGVEKLALYAARLPHCVGVLILCDADDDCPVELAKELAGRVRRLRLPVPVAVVCAMRMFENWFLASLPSLIHQKLGRRSGLQEYVLNDDPEAIRHPKDLLDVLLEPSRSYKETMDQLPMTELLDVPLACQNSRSFRRLDHALHTLFDAIEDRSKTVTP
jgi:hypothetical protein